MDNGRVSQDANKNEDAPGFFTTGVDKLPDEINPDEANSLNSSPFSELPEQNSHDYGKVGNIASGLTPPPNGELVPRPEQIELSANEIEFEAPEIPQPPEPPFEIISEEPPAKPTESTIADNSIDTNTLRANHRDRLSSAAKKTVKRYVHEFKNGDKTPKDLVDFYEVASEAYRKSLGGAA